MHSSENPTTEVIRGEAAVVWLPRQAETDQQLIELWLHGRSRHTRRAYRADADRFLRFVGKRLHAIALGDLQVFADSLTETGLRPASRHRILSAVKSILSFGHRLGYLPYDVGRPLKIEGFRDGLADRILDEGQIQRMIALEPQRRNQVLLLILYASGVRVSELSGLRWIDLQPREQGGQATILGKGNKTRTILLPRAAWTALLSLGRRDENGAPIFLSRKGKSLSPSQIWRIVRTAAQRAGIVKPVSPHYYRHAHASHALDRGAPIHLVQATLGHASVSTTSRYLHARPDASSSTYLSINAL